MNLLPLDEIVFLAESHTYHLGKNSYPSVTGILDEVLGDPFADCPQDRLEFAQGRGNAVHAAAKLLTDGELDWGTVDPRIEGYVRAVDRFHEECPGKIIYTEKRMISPELGLAGTPDICMFVRGRRSLIDYKTSQQQSPRMRLQTAGYRQLHNALYPNAPIYDRYGLRLSADGTYKLILHDDYDDELAWDLIFNQFKAQQEAAQFVEKYK